MKAALAGAFLALLAQAPQSPPATLGPALRQLRQTFDDHRDTFGATDALTAAKHQLRDWMEAQIGAFPEGGDVDALQTAMNGALSRAGLVCTDFQDECGMNLLGYVDDIRVQRVGALLAVTTATGIWCGYDESAYVYAHQGQGWRRVWENEQNTYTKQGYLPQTIHDILVSTPDADGSRLIATLGSQASCGGSFKNLYARAWRLNKDGSASAALNWTGYADDGYPPIQGRIMPDEIFFEFMAGGLAAGDPHTAIRHFKIVDRNAVQIDPIAATPRDFVVEWLTAPWEESRTRSDAPSLQQWHETLRRKDPIGDFPDAPLRCTAGPDLWQIGTYFYEGPKRYYRVRWQQPYTFTMMGVGETPFADCTQPDSDPHQ